MRYGCLCSGTLFRILRAMSASPWPQCRTGWGVALCPRRITYPESYGAWGSPRCSGWVRRIWTRGGCSAYADHLTERRRRLHDKQWR